ncbi:MAG: DUF664 domain-containing protein [Anaerolineae bacterium]|nr:DUF664 domain-containing protein [Anaerolineae bacterium]
MKSYLERIDDLRGQIRLLLESIPSSDLPDALNWRPIETSEDDHATNSLAVMAMHAAGAEHFWIGEVIGELSPTRERDAEFQTKTETVDDLFHRLDAVAMETRAVMEGISPTQLDETRKVRGKSVPVRWSILHVIDHTALHLGHMQLTYQLWMGGKAGKSLRWFERLK